MTHTPRVYTLEVFSPAFPSRPGRVARAMRGTIEENREVLSPSMVAIRELTLSHPMQTPARALKSFAKKHGARVITSYSH